MAYGKRYTAAQKAAYYAKLRGGKRGGNSYGRQKVVSGNGDYFVRFKNNYKKPYRYPGAGARYGSSIGSAIGNSISPGIGGIVGGGIGRGLGRLAQSAIKTVSGFGDYEVSKNSLVYNSDAVPQFTHSDRCTIISHREFISDVRGSTAFKIDSYNINPSNSALFPWLSGLAQNYEQWVVQGMIFEFKTTCATAVASTNTALGTVVLATQYNSLAQQFNSKVQMENYEFAQSSVPSASIMHPIECDPTQTAGQGLFYIDNDGYNANADPRLYNIGKFNIATVGMQAAATIGELWVTYKICLLKPKLNGMTSIGEHFVLDPTTVTSVNPFGDNPILSTSSTSYAVQNTDQASVALKSSPWSGATSNTAIYINPNFVGYLQFTYSLACPAGVAYVDPLPSIFGTLEFTDFLFAVEQKVYNIIDVGIQISFVIKCPGGLIGPTYPYLTLTAGTLPAGTSTIADLAIFSVPANLTN